MPAFAPSYIYTFFALITVSSILISSFAAYAATLRTLPEIEQLRNILENLAARGYELVALSTTTNATSRVTVQLPSSIGNREYWVRLKNESSKAWVEGALGRIHEGSPVNRIYLPKETVVSGHYPSGHGQAVLECHVNGSIACLKLGSWRDSA